jgi:hypothetical protein
MRLNTALVRVLIGRVLVRVVIEQKTCRIY